ncbi:hypothetical protein GCM10023084_81320 [Streptomyces lacrimifluminis]
MWALQCLLGDRECPDQRVAHFVVGDIAGQDSVIGPHRGELRAAHAQFTNQSGKQWVVGEAAGRNSP